MAVLDRVLGTPWVYEYIRPLAVGGIDYSRAYQSLRCDQGSVILDLGCGTGDALRHLGAFDSYVGIDTDERAIRYARTRWAGRANVRFESRLCTPDDIRSIAPTHIAMVGLLHHLHSGEQFGPVGTIISMLSGLALFFFAFSGLYLYIQMYRGRLVRTEAGKSVGGGRFFW